MTNWHDAWQQMWIEWGPVRLRQPVNDRKPSVASAPLSAQEAWMEVLPIVQKFDSQARLRAVQSEGAQEDGRAAGWEFHIDGLTRRAKGVFKWRLCEGKGELVRELAPFPPIGSPVHRVVSSGYGSAKLLDAAWEKMREGAIDLPRDFEDSTRHATSFSRQASANGGHMEMALSTTGGAPAWRALVDGREFTLA